MIPAKLAIVAIIGLAALVFIQIGIIKKFESANEQLRQELALNKALVVVAEQQLDNAKAEITKQNEKIKEYAAQILEAEKAADSKIKILEAKIAASRRNMATVIDTDKSCEAELGFLRGMLEEYYP